MQRRADNLLTLPRAARELSTSAGRPIASLTLRLAVRRLGELRTDDDGNQVVARRVVERMKTNLARFGELTGPSS